MVERYTDQQLLDAGFNPALIPIIKRESGGKSVGWEGLPGAKDYAPGGTDLSGYPLKSTGFPAWPGKMGPEGNSTAAGVAQITGSTWDPVARKLGITDFSLESQAKVANELYRRSGTSDWRASEPGYRPPYYGTKEGYQSDTGVTHITAQPLDSTGLSPVGAALLGNMLKDRYGAAEEPTGNSLLDGLLKSSLFGPTEPEQAPQPSPTDVAAKQLQQAPPPPPPPQTVPELQPGQPIPTPRIQPIQQPPMPSVPTTPMPGQPSVPAAPPPAPPQPMQMAGNLLGFGAPDPQIGANTLEGWPMLRPSWATPSWLQGPVLTPQQLQQPLPRPLPLPANQAANTGNNLLNQLLKQVSPISTAQAAEREPPPQPQPQQQAPPASTGNNLLDNILKAVPFAQSLPVVGPAIRAGVGASHPLENIKSGLEMFQPPESQKGLDITTPQGFRQAALDPAGLERAMDVGLSFGLGTTKGEGPRAEPPPLRAEPGAGGRPPEPPPPPSTAAQPPTNPPPGSPPPSLTPPPGGSGPVIEPPTFPDGAKVAADRLRLQDDLNWVIRSSYANAIELKQFYDKISPEFKTPEFRANVAHEIEQRLIDPNAPLSPETERFLQEVKPLTDAEHSLGEQLAKHDLTPEQAEELGISLRTVEEGHVHRMVEGQQLPGEILPTNIDPITGRPRSGGGRSLGTSASGMKQRTDYFVGQDDAGNRVFSPKRLGEQMPLVPKGYTRFYSDDRGGWVTDRDVIRKRNPTGRTTRYVDFPTTQAGQFRVGDAYNLPDAQRNSKLAPPEKYGDRYQQGHTSYTAREPTMRENEANTPIRYVHDYLLGLFNNVARLNKVLRTLNTIERQKKLLGPEGARLWQPAEGRFLHTPPVYVDATGNRVPFQHVNLSQLRGWAHPRIANTINDFVGSGDNLETTLEHVLDHMTRSLFILPFGHIRNVGVHYMIGRGLDWAYRNPRLLQSFNEIWHMGPIYQRWLRENGPAMYPGAADVHGKLVEKLLHDMAHDPGWEITAKTIGTTMKKLLPEIYKWSSRTLWFANDHLFLARTLENLAKLGHRDPLNAPSQAWKRAIADTKREIPAYEMPDQVLGSRKFRNMLTRMPIAFGRYTKDKYEILGNNVVDMVGKGPHGKGMPQLQAAAQALITLMLSFPVMSVLNSALQRVTGNENAKVYGAGPISIIRAAGGGIGKLAGVDPDSRLGWALGMTDDEIDLSHALSGILTLTPGLSTFMQLFGGGHDPYTGQPMVAKFASPEGAASQFLTALASSFYPTEILVRALREGPGALFEPLGFNAAGYQSPSVKAQLMQKRMEAARERRDQFEDLIQRGEQWFQQPGAVDYGRAGF